MNKILWLQFEPDSGLAIGFRCMSDADNFIREQSNVAGWHALWEIRYHGQRDEVMIRTKERVVLHVAR